MLRSPKELIGAAISLGALDVGSLSKGELQLLKGAEQVRLSPAARAKISREVRDGGDPLGDAFCRLFNPDERRPNGATYTPANVVESMLGWAAEEGTPQRVVDPGAGSARFTLAAGRRFPKAKLIAVEQDPLAALIARANCALAELGDRVTVDVSDYRQMTLPETQGWTLFAGNPPYVRHHNIGTGWKEWLAATAAEHGHQASRLAGLHVHFFLATLEKARPGDRGVFITAAEWLDVNYGSLVREMLLDGLGGRALHLLEPELHVFEDAATTAAITCFEVGAQPSSLRLRRVKRIEDLDPLNGGQLVRRERLAEAMRWTPLTRAAKPVPDGFIELGELCRVHRGAVTGANRVWVVDLLDAELPRRVLFPSVTRAHELFSAGEELASSRALRRVVDLPEDLDRFDGEDRKQIDRFLRRAKRMGAHKGYVATHRRAWWSVGLRAAAPLLTTYMARRAPAIVRNSAKARHINIAHGIYPRQQLEPEQLDLIAESIRARISVGDGRTYAGGLTKFEPRELERILIPDLPGA